MKLRLFILFLMLMTLCQFNIQASHSSHKHKHRSTRQIVKNIEKIDKEILKTVNNIQNTDNQILDTVITINEKLECSNVILASDIGTTGYIISEPGVYCLGEDVVFNPANPSTFVPVTFSGGGGSGATGFAAVSGGVVRGVFLTNRGSGYTSAPTVTFGGAGSGAAGAAVVGSGSDVPTGEISYVAMSSGGSGYQNTVQAAITINASNVTLKMNGYELSQFVPANPSAQVPFVVGILVPDPLPNATQSSQPNLVIGNPLTTTAIGLESVYIVGDEGIVSNFSMYGVRVFSHINDVAITDLTIKDNGGLASLALGRPTASGLQYLPHDQGITAPLLNPYGPSFGVAGLSIGESVGLGQGPYFFTDFPTDQLNVVNRIQDVRLNNVKALNNFMFGGSIVCSTDLTIEDSRFDYTWSDDPGSLVPPIHGAIPAYGMMFKDKLADANAHGNTSPCNVDIMISNSTFNNSSLNGDYTTPLANSINTDLYSVVAIGFNDTQSKNMAVYNSQFNNSSCTFPNSGGGNSTYVLGYLTGSSQDLAFYNCSFDNQFNLGAINGFHCSGTSTDELSSNDINIKLINCSSSNHQVRPDLILPAPPLTFSGFPILSGFETVFTRGLYIEDCQVSNLYFAGPATSDTQMFGFLVLPIYSADISDICFKNCKLSRVQSVNGGCALGYCNFTTFFGIGAGLTANSLIFEDCKATGNQALVASVYPAWSGTTTYSVGALVSLTVSGVVNNFVSLHNSNTGHSPVPGTATAFWSPINTNPPAWNVATTYSLGQQVSFTDSTGHTNEYISIINNNTGIYPNAPGISAGLGTDFSVAWIQTNTYPTWSSSASYSATMIVGYRGISYQSLVSTNQGNQPNISPSDWTNSTGVGQGVGIGFLSLQDLNSGTIVSGPEVYKNCIATLNTGALGPISTETLVGSGSDLYSGGFAAVSAQSSEYDSCIAAENSGYGFLLSDCIGCVVRECKSDNNSAEGFTDLGPTGTPANVGISASYFEGNSAYNNGTSNAPHFYFGPNNNYNILVAPGVTPPLFEVKVSSPATSYLFINPTPTGFGSLPDPNVYNISTIP